MADIQALNTHTPRQMMRFGYLWIGVGILLSSCTRGIAPSTYLIPQDAFFASRMNILRATYQVPDWKRILKEELLLDLDADTVHRPNFLGSGQAFLFGDLLEKEKNYVAFAVTMLSRRNFERFVASVHKEKDIQACKNFKYFVHNRNLMAWSHHILLIINARQADNDAEIVRLLQRLVDQPRAASLYATNQNFRSALRNDRDLSLWTNVQEMMQAEFLKKFIKNFNLKDNYLHILADFDEGKINAQTEYFTSPALYAAYKTLLSGRVDKELIENIPVGNPAVMACVGINPAGLPQFLQDIEWTEKAENLVKSLTLTMDQFVDMVRGDGVLLLKSLDNTRSLRADSLNAAAKRKRKKDPDKSDFMLGIGLRNPARYDTLMNLLTETGLMEKKEGYHYFFGEIFVLRRGNSVYFTKDESIKEDFLNGVKFEQNNLLPLTDNSWFILHAEESIAKRTIRGTGLPNEMLRSILQKENVKLESATIHLSRMREKTTEMPGESMVILKDKSANSLLAMLEVLKEIIYQTKLRIDPNFVEDVEQDRK